MTKIRKPLTIFVDKNKETFVKVRGRKTSYCHTKPPAEPKLILLANCYGWLTIPTEVVVKNFQLIPGVVCVCGPVLCLGCHTVVSHSQNNMRCQHVSHASKILPSWGNFRKNWPFRICKLVCKIVMVGLSTLKYTPWLRTVYKFHGCMQGN